MDQQEEERRRRLIIQVVGSRKSLQIQILSSSVALSMDPAQLPDAMVHLCGHVVKVQQFKKEMLLHFHRNFFLCRTTKTLWPNQNQLTSIWRPLQRVCYESLCKKNKMVESITMPLIHISSTSTHRSERRLLQPAADADKLQRSRQNSPGTTLRKVPTDRQLRFHNRQPTLIVIVDLVSTRDSEPDRLELGWLKDRVEVLCLQSSDLKQRRHE